MVVQIYCEPCDYKGDGVETEKGIVCPNCGEYVYDSISKEEFDMI